jgi:dTDP-4-amino-4,6-dideoxygalactose transaminase
MDPILEIARKHGLRVIEDAAQGVDALYGDRFLGTIGDIGTYSFHETKNVIAGEGGALCLNDPELVARAEILREKGTNRAQFFRGEVDKYTWVDVGSSEVTSELVAAFLCGQLERLEEITERRLRLWDRYHEAFEAVERGGRARRPRIPDGCTANGHIYYLLLATEEDRDGLMNHLRGRGILAVFHYVPLHLSPVGQGLGYRRGQFPRTEDLSARLLRLPIFHGLPEADQDRVIEETLAYLDR